MCRHISNSDDATIKVRVLGGMFDHRGHEMAFNSASGQTRPWI